MKRLLVLCQGAPVPPFAEGSGWERSAVAFEGPQSTHQLVMRHSLRALGTHLDGRHADLVRIAAYAFGVDQVVSRGGTADVYGDSWYRDITLCVPVSDPDFWRQEHVHAALIGALRAASGDRWSFVFTPLPKPQQVLQLRLDEFVMAGEPDSVTLFSGGLDSLCTTVQQVRDGARPLLLSHAPAPHVASRQASLRQELITCMGPGWTFPTVTAVVNRPGNMPARSNT